jgi:hypothetical protein
MRLDVNSIERLAIPLHRRTDCLHQELNYWHSLVLVHSRFVEKS